MPCQIAATCKQRESHKNKKNKLRDAGSTIIPQQRLCAKIGPFQSSRSVFGQASISARKPIAGESNHALSRKRRCWQGTDIEDRHPEHRYLAISKSAHRAAGLRRIICGTRCAASSNRSLSIASSSRGATARLITSEAKKAIRQRRGAPRACTMARKRKATEAERRARE
jgi:hypothetical protein